MMASEFQTRRIMKFEDYSFDNIPIYASEIHIKRAAKRISKNTELNYTKALSLVAQIPNPHIIKYSDYVNFESFSINLVDIKQYPELIKEILSRGSRILNVTIKQTEIYLGIDELGNVSNYLNNCQTNTDRIYLYETNLFSLVVACERKDVARSLLGLTGREFDKYVKKFSMNSKTYTFIGSDRNKIFYRSCNNKTRWKAIDQAEAHSLISRYMSI